MTRSTRSSRSSPTATAIRPLPVLNLVAVSRLRRVAQKAGLSEVVAMGGKLRVAPAELADSLQVRMQRLYPGARLFTEAKALSVPMLVGIANPQNTDAELIDWVAGLLAALFPAPSRNCPPLRWLRTAARSQLG